MGSPTDSRADFAWLQHMVKSMDKDNGRCAVVLPQGVRFHGGRAGEIRKQLIESDKLECVITLVSGLFYSTGVSACILILNNNKPSERKGKVCFIDTSQIYTPQRAQNIMTEKNVEEAFNLYKDYKDVIEKSKVATIEDIRAKDYTLSINSYIEKAEQETISPQKIKKNFFQALEEAIAAEENFKRLLVEGGYINE